MLSIEPREICPLFLAGRPLFSWISYRDFLLLRLEMIIASKITTKRMSIPIQERISPVGVGFVATLAVGSGSDQSIKRITIISR